MDELKMETFPDVIELNVGGKHLGTMLSTLTKYPDTMLAAMFSGRHVVPRDKDGRYFIDCDGNMFEYILNFLRLGSLPNNKVSREVYALADYFGLRDIMLKHKDQLSKTNQEEEVIELNVRGTIIAAKRSTLTKQKDSKLASMFTESPQLSKDSDGRFYIDCKPDVFQFLLDFLALNINYRFIQKDTTLHCNSYYRCATQYLGLQL